MEVVNFTPRPLYIKERSPNIQHGWDLGTMWKQWTGKTFHGAGNRTSFPRSSILQSCQHNDKYPGYTRACTETRIPCFTSFFFTALANLHFLIWALSFLVYSHRTLQGEYEYHGAEQNCQAAFSLETTAVAVRHDDTPNPGTQKLTRRWKTAPIILTVVIRMICGNNVTVRVNLVIRDRIYLTATIWKIYHPVTSLVNANYAGRKSWHDADYHNP